MTIGANYKPVKLSTNGITTSFSFDFELKQANYLIVVEEIDEAQQIVSPDKYSLNFNDSGGTINFHTAPDAGRFIIISRQVPQNQETPFITSSGFQAERIEESLDKLTAITQQLNDGLERTPKLPLGVDMNLFLPQPKAGKALLWNNMSTGLTNSNTNLDEIEQTVTATLENATQKAAESAQSAKQSETAAQEAAETLTEIMAKAEFAKIQAERAEQVAIKAADTFKLPLYSEQWLPTQETRTGLIPLFTPGGFLLEHADEICPQGWADFIRFRANNEAAFNYNESKYREDVANFGFCGGFVVDVAAKSIRFPYYNDNFIRSYNGGTIEQADQLQGHWHNVNLRQDGRTDAQIYDSRFGTDGLAVGQSETSGADERILAYNTDRTPGVALEILADMTNGTPRVGTYTRPKSVGRYPFFVFYNDTQTPSAAAIEKFLQQVIGKADTNLENVTTNIDFVVETWISSDGNSWCRRYRSGWLEQGVIIRVATNRWTFPKAFQTTNITFAIAMSNRSDSGIIGRPVLKGWTKEYVNLGGLQNEMVPYTIEAKGL